jgi:ferric-dicitrate binding protein FerR (iron transport regulator)
MRHRRTTTWLEELETIDNALLKGTSTARQERRGQQIVTLANASASMLTALRVALPYMEDLANSSHNKGERRAARLTREAIREALEGES